MSDDPSSHVTHNDLSMGHFWLVSDGQGVITGEILAAAQDVSDTCYKFIKGGFSHQGA